MLHLGAGGVGAWRALLAVIYPRKRGESICLPTHQNHAHHQSTTHKNHAHSFRHSIRPPNNAFSNLEFFGPPCRIFFFFAPACVIFRPACVIFCPACVGCCCAYVHIPYARIASTSFYKPLTQPYALHAGDFNYCYKTRGGGDTEKNFLAKKEGGDPVCS